MVGAAHGHITSGYIELVPFVMRMPWIVMSFSLHFRSCLTRVVTNAIAEARHDGGNTLDV